MEAMHSLLKRQLRRHFGESFSVPQEWQGFIDSVNKAYQGFDADRGMLERSLELSSHELLQANSEMRAIFQSIPDLMLRLDSSGTILAYEAGGINDFYLEPKELLGKKIQDVPLREVDTGLDEVISHVLEAKSIANVEYCAMVQDRKRWYEARFLPVQNQVIVIIRDISERKEAEKLLKESEQLLERIIQGSPIPTFVIGKDHRVIFWNRALEELSQISAGEVVGTSNHWTAFYRAERPCMADLLVDDDIESIPQWYRGHVSQSKLVENAFESTDFFPELGKAGKWLHFTAAAIRDSRGGLVGAVTTLEDITDIKLAEDALKESRQQLGDIIDFLPDATLVIDKERRVIAWNRAMEEMTGIRAADILEKGDYEYALPFYGERRPILIDLVLGRQEELEARNAKADKSTTLLSSETYVPALMGTGAYLFGKASALRDSKGNIVGAIESIRDITERRRVEDALAQAEEKYRSIFENAVTGIYQSTLDGRILNANQAFSRMLGYESPQELSNTIEDLSRQLYVYPERRSELLRLVEKEGMVREFEVQFFRKDRSIAWLALNLRAVRDSGGKLVYLEGTAQDITVRKALESRLLQTHKMEAIGTLAGGVAHDFNNILTAISGYSEMVKRRLPEGEISGYIERVLQACDRAKNLVGQILTFSRGVEHQIRPVDIRPLTAEAVKMLRATLPATIDIRLEIESEVPAVLADPTHIHQVIVNLCTNAAHAMREHGGFLDVHLEKVEISPDMLVFHSDLMPGRYIRLRVMDTGVGIAPEIVHRIFDPFFTTKQQGEGTGLGLSVVYGIVKESRGTISVHSEPGVGSVFSVYLPAIAEDIKPAEESSTTIPGGNETILFVDDEDILIELGRDMLEDLGYQVVACQDSHHALEAFRSQQNRFDIVITDMTMPGMTGLDLAREILKIRPDIPIILCTGFSELVTEEKAKGIGIREFMMKPFTTKTIAEVINKALGKS